MYVYQFNILSSLCTGFHKDAIVFLCKLMEHIKYYVRPTCLIANNTYLLAICYRHCSCRCKVTLVSQDHHNRIENVILWRKDINTNRFIIVHAYFCFKVLKCTEGQITKLATMQLHQMEEGRLHFDTIVPLSAQQNMSVVMLDYYHSIYM